MRGRGRILFPIAALVLLFGAIVWAISFEELPPADFTFVNGTEIKSVDPAIVTGAPEGRVLRALYEGLVSWDAKTLRPVPGVAKLIPDGKDADGRLKWKADISEDGKTYTFHLREDAKWSNGEPITSQDFMYSFRRFLDPLTGAEYAYQMFYVVGAEKYNKGLVEVDDAVEVEMREPPEDALSHARGKVVRGKLKKKTALVLNEDEIANAEEGEEIDPIKVTLFEVETDDGLRRFKTGSLDELEEGQHGDHESARQVLVDFDTVDIKAPDKHTLVVTLKDSTPFFLSLMGFYPMFPVNQKCVETHGYPAWTDPKNLVTNGPFRLGMRRIRDRIRLVKSDQYWDRDNVKLNVVDALAVEDATTGLNLYETGKVDWITTVPNTIIPEMLEQGRKDFVPAPYLGTYFYRVNTTRPPTDDVRVRKALSLVMDRKKLVEDVTRAGQIPAYSFVPPNIPGYTAEQTDKRNIEEAKKLLAEAGYPGGEGCPKITLVYNTNESHKQIAEVLQAQWKEHLNIDVELENQEWGAYLSTLRAKKYGIGRAGWIGDYVDPNTFLDMFVTDGANNQTGWSNEEYDKIIKEIAPRESDPQKRMEHFRQAERILMNDLPVIPIYFYVSTSMVRPYVKGFYRNIQDVHPLKGVYIDKEEKAKVMKEIHER